MLPLKDTTVDREFRRTVSLFPKNRALSFEGRCWTYSEFDLTVTDYAKRLIKWGVTKGSHVGILCEAEPNTLFMIFALNRIGAVVVMLNTMLKSSEIEKLLESTEVEFLLIGDGYEDNDYRQFCRGFIKTVTTLKDILYIGYAGKSSEYLTLPDLDPNLLDDALLLNLRDSVKPEDDAFILFTSGTTDKPKAVVGSQYSRANSGLQQGRDLGMTEQDKVVCAMPVFHCFCLSVNVLAALFCGACLCLPKSRHTKELLKCIRKEQVTVFSSVPALFHAIINSPVFDRRSMNSLRIGFIGGNSCSQELFKQIEQSFGFKLLSSLGQTEATAGFTTSSMQDTIGERAATVGHFMDHVEYCFKGNRSEVCIRGYVVMKGYYNDPEATEEAIDSEGWLHTGDCGYINDKGNLVLTGRIKDFIIRGGENISPKELESVILDESDISECKAIGIPDEHYGEVICICIIKKNGSKITESIIRKRYTDRIAKYKVPKYIVFCDDFPRSPTGKILSNELKKIITERIHTENEKASYDSSGI